MKPVAKKKSEILLIHIRTNDLRKSVNTTRKVRKYVEVIQELNNEKKSGLDIIVLFRDLIKILAMKLQKTILS